jgi:hypothetical protein
MNRLLNKFQNHVFICGHLNEFWKKKNCMLNLNFKNSFMLKIIKLNFLLYLKKDLIWFGGEDLGASP